MQILIFTTKAQRYGMGHIEPRSPQRA